MKKFIKINDVTFQIIKDTTKKYNDLINKIKNNEGYTLWDVYTHPSKNKIDIYNWWNNFSDTANGGGLFICSHSKMVFTLSFTLNFEGVKYWAYITPSHNYLLKYNNFTF